MKPLFQSILTIGLGYLAHQFLPFWAIALVAGVVALFFSYRNSLTSFSVGLISAFLLWAGYALLLGSNNAGLLTSKLGELFPVGSSYLGYATGLFGGLLGGFGALTGSLARRVFWKGNEAIGPA